MHASTAAPHVPSVPRPEAKQSGAAIASAPEGDAAASFRRRHDQSHLPAAPDRQQSNNWAFAPRESTSEEPPPVFEQEARKGPETRLRTALSASPRNISEPPSSFARMTRKRAAEQAGFDEDQLSAEQESALETEQQVSPSSHICLCQPDPKIPRPRNAFILYRQHHHADILREYPGSSNPDISKIAGQLWAKEPDNTKDEWKKLAEEEKLRHSLQFPEYRFQPRHKTKGRAANTQVTEKGRCIKCGGRSISSIGSIPSSPQSTNPPNSGSTDQSTPGHRTLPHLQQLKLTSPQKTPTSPLKTLEPPTGTMAESAKKRRYESYGSPAALALSNRVRDEGRPVTSAGRPSPVFTGYNSQNRRDSLPPPPSATFTRGSERLGHPMAQSPTDRNAPMGPPPPRSAMLSRSVNGIPPPPPTPRSIAVGPQSPSSLRYQSPQGPVHIPESPRVSSLGSVDHNRMMPTPFLGKIRILRRVVPPIRIDASMGPNISKKGAIIAVEGDKDAPTDSVLAALEMELRKTGEFDVQTMNGPGLPGTNPTFGQYLGEVARWHTSCAKLYDLLVGPPKDDAAATTNSASGTPKAVRVSDTSEDVKMAEADDAMSKSASEHSKRPSLGRRDSITSQASAASKHSAMSSLFYASTSSHAEPSSSGKITLVLIPSYLVGSSDAWAAALPIRDAYGSSDHWSWAATVWRGVLGPDFTIYVRSEEGEAAQRQGDSMDWAGSNNKSHVDISEDMGTLVVRSSKEKGMATVDGAAVRRVAFEVAIFPKQRKARR
ncbi:hypothetical protein BT63DRAFT_412551 [Microthyrium microscopicum]|uniref:HMG box domain-containing protein n=1 Tax=Microthyrium microscopicum TaxID=703497 RepID=A0A6A6UH67_9PEZI|nr:hypothetical protein BT63DRAFT_412551 [Microthyrium microscopicum]